MEKQKTRKLAEEVLGKKEIVALFPALEAARDPRTVAEILAHQYVHRADSKIILEEKVALRSRLGRSPDLFDALAMALGSERESFAGISVSDGMVSF